jgi:hypothetical protein
VVLEEPADGAIDRSLRPRPILQTQARRR